MAECLASRGFRALASVLGSLGCLALGSLACLGCSQPRSPGTLATFPSSSAWAPLVLPMRDPLQGPHLEVHAQLAGQPGPGRQTASSWMAVDSGATAVALPPHVVQQLALKPFMRATVRAALRDSFETDAVLVPSLALGALTLTNVVAFLYDEKPIVGQSVLRHAPWELDWDLGRVILGTHLWPADTPAMIVVPLRKHPDYDLDIVSLTIEGRAIDFLLDTGAQASAIPASLAAGLPSRELAPSMSPGRRFGNRQFLGDTWIGPWYSGRLGFVELLPGRASWGLLGLDVLGSFHVQIVPGQRLLLRPREGLWQTASERVRRWSWTVGCLHRGCVEAALMSDSKETTLSLRVERALPQPIQLLLGCEGDARPVVSRASIVANGGAMTGALAHVSATLSAGVTGLQEATLLPRGDFWFRRPNACERLSVLDIVPFATDERLSAPLTATLTL